jgi:hypothetical protein
VRIVVGLFCLILLPAAAREFREALAPLFRRQFWPLGAGAVAGVVLEQLLLRRIPGLEVFEHELTHAIAALFCFRRVTKFRITLRNGGFVAYSGGSRAGDDFIGLAPYFLPTLTVFTAAVRPLAPPAWFPWFDLWLGFTLGFHAWSALREARDNSAKGKVRAAGVRAKTDIGQRGWIYSFLFIAAATLAIHGAVFRTIPLGYRGLFTWGRHLGAHELRFAQEAIALLRRL